VAETLPGFSFVVCSIERYSSLSSACSGTFACASRLLLNFRLNIEEANAMYSSATTS
jgi:hypothetical protein